MDVLRNHKTFIGSQINVAEAADILKYHNHLNEYEIYGIKNEIDNQKRMTILMDILTEQDNTKGCIKLLDIVRCSYPKISSIIPEIHMGLRIKLALGNQKMLKVSIHDLALAVDIRQYEVNTLLLLNI